MSQLGQFARDIEEQLRAREFPIRVAYGPERFSREGGGHFAIVISRDRGAPDVISVVGAQRNPQKIRVRSLAARADIYARSSTPGAMREDHETILEQFADAFMVELYEWGLAAKAGPIPITEARFWSNEERQVLGSVGDVYMFRFLLPRAVCKRAFDGSALPTGEVAEFITTTKVSIDGETYETVEPVVPLEFTTEFSTEFTS